METVNRVVLFRKNSIEYGKFSIFYIVTVVTSGRKWKIIIRGELRLRVTKSRISNAKSSFYPCDYLFR